jgi:hypothetical protein
MKIHSNTSGTCSADIPGKEEKQRPLPTKALTLPAAVGSASVEHSYTSEDPAVVLNADTMSAAHAKKLAWLSQMNKTLKVDWKQKTHAGRRAMLRRCVNAEEVHEC